MVQKWEYLTHQCEMAPWSSSPELKLNDLGDEGWELVAAVVIGDGEHRCVCLFKRPKDSDNDSDNKPDKPPHDNKPPAVPVAGLDSGSVPQAAGPPHR